MNAKQWIRNAFLYLGALKYPGRGSRVIYYHDLHKKESRTPMSTPLRLFLAHLQILEEEGFEPVTQIGKEKGEVEITFDDGFHGLYENFDLFLSRKIPVRVFFITDRIGAKNYMNATEIRELLQTGLLSIGSHTLSHANLDTLDAAALRREVEVSKKRLEDLFSVEVDSFCYPRGRFTPLVIEEARRAGYRLQYSCLPGRHSDFFDEGVVNRSLVQNATPWQFRQILRRGDEIFKERYKTLHFRDRS